MAKPKLALIPAAQGSKLFSVLPSSGVGDFDFTRSGSATRINSQGLIEEVSNGQSRLNYLMIDGKVVGCPHHILEGARTNLIQYSEDFSNTYWNKTSVTVTSNEAISPDGTLNASKLIEGTSNSRQETWKNIVTTTSYNVVSCFIKKGTSRFASIVTSDSTHWNTMVVIDLELGIITKTYNGSGFSTVDKIENYGNGWYRLTSSITGAFIGNVLYARINIQNSGTPNNPPGHSYIGDGTSYIYIWGAMVEEGSYPTSYIKSNSGSTTTRSAETANGSGDAATFNDSEGVLMAEIKSLDSSDTSSRRLGITKDGTYEGLRLQYGNGNISAAVFDGATNQYSESVNIDNSIFHKVALKYKTNDFALWIDGIEYFPQSSGSTFVNGTLDDISFDYVGGNHFYSNTKQIQYYNSALTDSEIEQLTSWTSFTDMAQGQQYSIK